MEATDDADFMLLFNELLLLEKGYSDHPSDAGGKTMYGITENKARKHGWRDEMSKLPVWFARNVYFKDYWTRPGFQSVYEYSPIVGSKLFDAGVNIGTQRASAYLQKVLNAFNRNQLLYDDIKVDAKIGDKTLGALDTYLQYRGHQGDEVMAKAICCLQGEFYLFLSQKKPSQEDFVYGWINKRIKL